MKAAAVVLVVLVRIQAAVMVPPQLEPYQDYWLISEEELGLDQESKRLLRSIKWSHHAPGSGGICMPTILRGRPPIVL